MLAKKNMSERGSRGDGIRQCACERGDQEGQSNLKEGGKVAKRAYDALVNALAKSAKQSASSGKIGSAALL